MNTLKVLKLNSVVSLLGTLAILAFGVVVIPADANADQAGFGITPYGSTQFNNNYPVSQYNSVQPPAYTPPPIVNTPPPIVNTANNQNGEVQGATTTVEKIKEKKEDTSNIAANAIFGTNNFLPSGLLQWIFFAILILIIVVLVRKTFGADKRYHESPLKHA